MRQETEAGLEAFRAAQKETGKLGLEGEASDEEDLEESWAVAGGGRKRRREKERDKFKGVKRRASEE